MATELPVKLRVFSLNCWGLRFFSRHCSERYEMIADLLQRENHDIALLQEVWSERDFLFLKGKLSKSHPNTYYFRSGMVGSGLAVFSKHTIQDALLHQYSLNGQPYMVRHGDWFGGKAVGLVVLNVTGLRVNVYVTHLHAEYSRAEDEYLAHRILQSWELLQFIRHTWSEADVLVLGGDLNMHPEDLGNRLLRAYTTLRDCYIHAHMFHGCEDGHTLIADNQFIKKEDLIPFEKGIRIDYILIKGSGSVNIKCVSMCTTKGLMPEKPFPYSDHESLSVELNLQYLDRSTTETAATLSEQVDVTDEACEVMKKGIIHGEALQLKAIQLLMAGLLFIALLPFFLCAGIFLCSTVAFLGAMCVGVMVSGALLYILFSIQIKALRETEAQMKLNSVYLSQVKNSASLLDERTELQSPSNSKKDE
ncbi:hypothetical protein PHYPO_G00066660 [Pangasianodon hypophthalmus]|uniref:sphingomyelin phosphodiesterase n=1 Tax=Pangasianodon hypophthalmus TaxID=310915 RepID=A0A5N5LV26_PANHP|nr:hypothetical protein PHYPO_G00066660 [Pangasianodon hypophthalmus]